MYISYKICPHSDNVSVDKSQCPELFEFLREHQIANNVYTFNLKNTELGNLYTKKDLYHLSVLLLKTITTIKQINDITLNDINEYIEVIESYSQSKQQQLNVKSLANGLMVLDSVDIPDYLDNIKNIVITHNNYKSTKECIVNKYKLGLLALFSYITNASLLSV